MSAERRTGEGVEPPAAVPAPDGSRPTSEAVRRENDRVAEEVAADVAAHPVEFGPAEDPDAPGPLPHPDHHVGVPGAPATNPPEPPYVPSEAAVAGWFGRYGATAIIVAVAIVVVAIIVASL